MTQVSRPPFPRLVLLLTWALLAAAAATPAAVATSEPGDPYLVRDIDLTGEPFYEECHVTCPPPVPEYGSLIEQLTPLGDLVVFVANDRMHGFEPWVSDGTAEGTRLLADACPGECSALAPRLLGVLDGRLYFWSDHPMGGGARLWSTDGTPEGTRPLDELCPELCGVVGEGPGVVFEGALLFQVYQAAQSRRFLWRTDGTVAGTERLLPVCTRPSVCFERFSNFFTYRGWLFFNDWADLRRLGAPGGTPVVAWSGTPDSAAQLGDRMLLGVNASLSSLWVMDGPLAEPRLVTHLDAGTRISQMTAAGGFVYFVLTEDQEDQMVELWRTDGTAEGTGIAGGYAIGRGVDVVGVLGESPIVRIVPDPGPLPVVLPTLLRVDPDGGGAEALSYRPVQAVAVAADRIFFSAEDDIGRELWVSDGTGAGTALLADIAPGPASSAPGAGTGFAEAGGLLFFPAFHPDVDTELWALDLNTGEEPPPSPPPPPPSTEWLESPEVPGFRAQVRITGGGSSLLGRQEAACIPEALCVSGAVPGRSEVFVRVVGPKPNGFLWPTLVKFSTSTVEVWIEQASTQEVRYYLLEGARPGIDRLPGLFDRTGFRP